MFPLRDDNPTFHTSFATFTIIGLNVATWIFLQGLGSPEPLARSICEFGLIPGDQPKERRGRKPQKGWDLHGARNVRANGWPGRAPFLMRELKPGRSRKAALK